MKRLVFLCAFAAVGGASPALAHVRLNSPNGGEVLEIGSIFTVEWQVVIAHDLQNWDLFYSTESNAGAWTVIALDLAPGDGSVGSIHTFEWTIPNDPSSEAWVRVVMDNSGQDYQDVSNASFSIVPAPGSGVLFAAVGVLACGRRRRR